MEAEEREGKEAEVEKAQAAAEKQKEPHSRKEPRSGKEPHSRKEPHSGKKPHSRKKRAVFLAAAAVIAAALVLSGFFAARSLRPKTQYELDRDALAGFLPNKSQKEIEEELNRIIDESRFNVSVNPTPVIENGRINVMIENVPANHYWMQADIYIQDPGQKKETLIYHSGIIRQGYYIDSGEAENTPAPGQYNGRAVFTAIKPDSDEEIGKVEATMVVFVEDSH